MTPVPARPSRPNPAHVAAQGRNGMISTSHPAATQAGLAALRRGGSAVDAYLAAAAVQTVVEPTMTTLAGGLVVTVYDPATGRSRAMAGVGVQPAAEDGDLDEAARRSGRTVVTPGWVRGAHAAWQEWGRLP
ncbi:gamma-glutamyltransferase, partial [Nonomuraea sp. NPDC050643]|uniref:gamma-glutamyltransferase n=1 Tax=Nonomuraea sp. NPDC050643 TaxID=3155660 RepID=UPI0033FD2325